MSNEVPPPPDLGERIRVAQASKVRRLRALRIARGLSQRDLAFMTGTNQPAIANIENHGFGSGRTLRALAKELGIEQAESLLDVVTLEVKVVER